MKRMLLILLFAAAVLAGGMSMATAGDPTTLGWGMVLPAQAPVAEPAAAAPQAEGVAAKAVAPTKARRAISRRERGKLGLSPRGIRATLRKLNEAGEFDELRDAKGRITRAVAKENAAWIAAAVLDSVEQENPAAFAGHVQADVAAGRDWSSFFDALLACLEKLIPVLLMFM